MLRKTLIVCCVPFIALVINGCCSPHLEERDKTYLQLDSGSQDAIPSDQLSGEAYSKIKENEFKTAGSQPLSTFSIDVDNASYSNVRRMLSNGMLPPVDAVRPEEFINYFSYNYKLPAADQVFGVHTELGNCPWSPDHQLLKIAIKGKEINLKETVPNNLVFLVDVSGSMNEPDKLPLLKKALKLLVKQMKKEDKLSMVVYAGSAGVVISGKGVAEANDIEEALNNLEAGGSTAGGQGIELAYKIALENRLKNGNNRIILATDGDFNVGISNVEELEEFISQEREEEVYLTVLGFGEGNSKDNVMETLADKGNGNYYYIDNFLEAQKVLVSQMNGTLVTIAKDVKAQIEFNPDLVKEYRLIGYENRLLKEQDFNNDKVDAGELGAGHCVTALYEIVPKTSKVSHEKTDPLKYQSTNGLLNQELATLKLRFKGASKNDTTSQLKVHEIMAKVLPDHELSTDFKLASVAAEFAQLLRNSKYSGNASYRQLTAMLEEISKEKSDASIAEMEQLITAAERLSEYTKK